MSVRKQTTNRRTLYRVCGTCGRNIVTTASTPWVRQIMEVDEAGKKHQYTRYFCSSKCHAASYKHIGWYDGKTQERRREKEARRDTRAKNRRYYAAHRDQERARAKARYWATPVEARRDNQFSRLKAALAVIA